MRYLFLICLMVCVVSCSTYKPLSKVNLKAVYVLYKDNITTHRQGYLLYDGSVVTWGTKHLAVKAALNSYRNKLSSLKKESANYLAPLYMNKKTYRYRPIKVFPLNEFGYIYLNSDQLILYGIMGSTFIDLTNNKVYTK